MNLFRTTFRDLCLWWIPLAIIISAFILFYGGTIILILSPMIFATGIAFFLAATVQSVFLARNQRVTSVVVACLLYVLFVSSTSFILGNTFYGYNSSLAAYSRTIDPWGLGTLGFGVLMEITMAVWFLIYSVRIATTRRGESEIGI